MVGKHKTTDVQFYTEVVEGSQALDSRRRSAYDPDEVDEEIESVSSKSDSTNLLRSSLWPFRSSQES